MLSSSDMRTKSKLSIPARSKLFAGITHEQAVEILTTVGATMETYRKGETIIRQWSSITSFFLVVSGSVHSYCRHHDGHRSVTGAFGPGDILGLVFAFSDLKKNPSCAIATSDATVIRIPIVDIISDDTFLSSKVNRRYLQNAVDAISQSAHNARLRSFVLSQRSIEERVKTYLNEISKRYNCAEFDIPYDRQELADFIETDRCALSSTLSRMRDNGKIDFRKNHFRIIIPFE